MQNLNKFRFFVIGQNFYITSNEKIEDGDHFYNFVDNTIHNQISAVDDFCKKIVHTTDSSLGIDKIPEGFSKILQKQYDENKIFNSFTVLTEGESINICFNEYEPEIPEFLDRLYLEHNKLKYKTEKLDEFLKSEKVENVDPIQKDLLNIQLSAMITYLNVLTVRISLINENYK